jgi:hypothetical protein
VKALSLIQPWIWIILNLGKRIENRSRNLGNFRGTLCLHASAKMTAHDWWSAHDFVLAAFGPELAATIPGRCRFGGTPPPTDELPLGAIVAIADVVNQLRPGGVWATENGCASATEALDMRWYMNDHAYVLGKDVKAVTKPVPCKGNRGLWNVPLDVAERLTT